MVKSTLLLVTILLFAAIMSAPALAGDILTITDVVQVDGKIGMYIRNDVGLAMRTDNSRDNISILNYYINNQTVYSIKAKSADKIPTDERKLVVLDAAWPQKDYTLVEVDFTDSSGTVYVPREKGYAFAKRGLELTEVRTSPEMVSANSSFTIYLKLKAGGESDVSNIAAESIAHPKYYNYVSMTKGAESMKMGDTAEYSLTYKLSGQGMKESITYETISVPVKFTYTYFGKHVEWTVNESVIIFNQLKVGNKLPIMKSLIEIPTGTIVSGGTTDIPVYVWNSNAGSNSACNMNLTLSEETKKLGFPISNIIPGDKTFPPAIDQSSEPIATFQVEVPADTPEGSYTLVLEGSYQDCEWNAPSSFKHTKIISVVKKTVIEEPASNKTVNGTSSGAISDIDDEAAKGPASKIKTYLFWVFLLIAAVIGVVYVLEKHGRHI